MSEHDSYQPIPPPSAGPLHDDPRQVPAASTYPLQTTATDSHVPPPSPTFPQGEMVSGVAAVRPSKKSHVGRWVAIGVGMFLLFLIVISIPLVAFFRKASGMTTALIQPLHQRMIAGDDAGIFAASDPDYQVQVGRARSDAMFDLVRDKLGAPGVSAIKDMKTSPATLAGGQQIIAEYNTQFAKGPGYEIVTLRNVNGQYRLIGYTVKSDLLPSIATK